MRLLLYFFLFPSSTAALAQDYNYIHYDTRDGLAGSTVYRMCQDKTGYIWFATDNGVSMFDGKKFRNFTTEDGITDNEVLFIDADGKGRVWMMPFNKNVCYYYKDKIHNNRNDSSLRKIIFSSHGLTGSVNSLGEIYLLSADGIFLYKNNGELKLICDYKKLARQYSLQVIDFVPVNTFPYYPYHMLLYNKHSVFMIRNDSVVYVKEVTSNPSLRRNFSWINHDLEVSYPDTSIPSTITSETQVSNFHILYNTLQGSWMLDSTGRIIMKPFLPGKKISNVLEDSEGNIWFSTLGEGVFRLTAASMKTFNDHQEAFCIEKVNGRMYAGYTDGNLQIIDQLFGEKNYPFNLRYDQSSNKRLFAMKATASGVVYLGYDSYIAKLLNGKLLYAPVRPIKSIDIINDQSIVVSTNLYTLKLNASDLSVSDTIWRDRGTKVIYQQGSYFIGTLNGLVIVDSDHHVTRIGESEPRLNKRIIDMCKMPDGSIWIATSDNGIILFKNGKVASIIDKKNGLGSNICKSLYADNNFLWAGTNKGLDKIDLINEKKIVAHYSVSDGLASDVINAIYTSHDTIWVCSPAGVTYFREKDISGHSICNLDLTAVYVSGEKINSQASIELSYRRSNISFEYTAISFKSAGDITYKYRLTGLDKEWKETKMTTLSYPSLPAGEYVFRLFAVNKFGKQSDTIIVHFGIAAPFWKTWWFWTCTGLFVLAIGWYFIRRRYVHLQQRLKEKVRIDKRMAELEQASLRAQMNPHFIFNCLNSIQHLVLKNDYELTNRYITTFADLIRQTLYNTARVNISIANEVRYLSNYLDLEKMRYASSFSYYIRLDENIPADYIFIPSMLLQPFVENAIRHGIRYKEDHSGVIRIAIWKDTQSLYFSVEDNGIGRKAAEQYKTRQHIEYQSKGITLTRNRLDILTAGNIEKATVSIIDMEDNNKKPIGTKVLVHFPLTVIEKLN